MSLTPDGSDLPFSEAPRLFAACYTEWQSVLDALCALRDACVNTRTGFKALVRRGDPLLRRRLPVLSQYCLAVYCAEDALVLSWFSESLSESRRQVPAAFCLGGSYFRSKAKPELLCSAICKHALPGSALFAAPRDPQPLWFHTHVRHTIAVRAALELTWHGCSTSGDAVLVAYREIPAASWSLRSVGVVQEALDAKTRFCEREMEDLGL